MKPNIGGIDRIIRFVAGPGLIGRALYGRPSVGMDWRTATGYRFDAVAPTLRDVRFEYLCGEEARLNPFNSATTTREINATW